MLIIKTPNINNPLIDFLLVNIFEGFLGVDYTKFYQNDFMSLEILFNNKKLIFDSSLIYSDRFDKFQDYKFFNKNINIVTHDILIDENLYDFIETQRSYLGGNNIIFGKNKIQTDMDLFGFIFFMLSRLEETKNTELDNHSRFMAKSSTAYKLGFLNRPIVDEYVELLWSMMKYLWPEIKKKEATTEIIVGCDVDTPFDCSSKSVSNLIRPLAGDLIKRRNLNQALTRVRRYFSFHRELEINKNLDPFYTFDYYMDVVEKAGLKATFFFIPDSKQPMNGCYDLEDKKILLLIKKITSRGHSIGLHGSYQSYSDRDILLNGKEKLYSVLNSIGISEPLIMNRQHYLRWDVKTTPDLLEEAGVDIDYSGGYADHAGFRYGTSKQFNLWSWKQKRMLNVVEQPLVIMECSIFDYQNLTYCDDTMNYLINLKKASMGYGGNFQLLWHNSYFMKPYDKNFFEMLILSKPKQII
jgi:hypothetical protein